MRWLSTSQKGPCRVVWKNNQNFAWTNRCQLPPNVKAFVQTGSSHVKLRLNLSRKLWSCEWGRKPGHNYNSMLEKVKGPPGCGHVLTPGPGRPDCMHERQQQAPNPVKSRLKNQLSQSEGHALGCNWRQNSKCTLQSHWEKTSDKAHHNVGG